MSATFWVESLEFKKMYNTGVSQY